MLYMPVQVMSKNYLSWPLKKRPIQIDGDISDEPENLSTKPQDLSRNGRLDIESPSSLLTTPPVSPSSSIKTSPSPSPVASSPYPPSHFYQPSPSLPIKVEPRESRLPPYPPPINPEYAPQTWHRSVAPLYPTTCHYMPYQYHHDYMPIPPASPHSDSSLSPPHHHHHHNHHHHHHQQPLQPLALRPSVYFSIDQSSLSPNSSTTSPPPPPPSSSSSSLSSSSSSSSAPIVPQDLSEKRQRNIRHQCPDCGKSYSTFSGLSKHRQFHCAAGDGPKKFFSCKYCDKVYVSLGALKMHIRTHTLPCKCTICGKAFSRPWLLQGHIRTHTGEKPFSCTYCNRAFADRSNLRAHLQTHSDVKKYSCPSCSKTFSRMSLLSKHAEGGCNGNAEKVY